MTIPIEKRMAYWRSLAGRAFAPRLPAGHIDELRAALRDAIHQIEEDQHRYARLETKSRWPLNVWDPTRSSANFHKVVFGTTRNARRED
jgi:hypothetical protein